MSEPKQVGSSARKPNNPLHGITLESMLREMVERFGWDGLARDIPLNCFRIDPSMSSALKYLRKAPRARAKVEAMYARATTRPGRGSNRGSAGARDIARSSGLRSITRRD